MSMDEQVQALVSAVLGKLLPAMGADGRRGRLIAVFTGATVGLDAAIDQVRSLIIRGFHVRLGFSEMADHLYGDHVRGQLAGFPEWSQLPAFTWLRDLKGAEGVVVPMLSVNTLSKLAALQGDNQTSNLILHGLFTGKPVIVADTGVLRNQGRIELGFHHGAPALWRALDDRLRLAAQYGCVLTDVSRLAELADGLAGNGRGDEAQGPSPVAAIAVPAAFAATGKVVTQGDVVAAHKSGQVLRLPVGAVITPLARDAASRLGVRLAGGGAA